MRSHQAGPGMRKEVILPAVSVPILRDIHISEVPDPSGKCLFLVEDGELNQAALGSRRTEVQGGIIHFFM